jgi:hypothetical protein
MGGTDRPGVGGGEAEDLDTRLAKRRIVWSRRGRAQLRLALREIAKGEGAYSQDQRQHAENAVEHMKALAVAALAALGEESCEQEPNVDEMFRLYYELRAKYDEVKLEKSLAAEAADQARAEVRDYQDQIRSYEAERDQWKKQCEAEGQITHSCIAERDRLREIVRELRAALAALGEGS